VVLSFNASSLYSSANGGVYKTGAYSKGVIQQ
jgi:hypothetical protein